MEFLFNVSEIFPDDISVVDNQLSHVNNKKNWRELKEYIGHVLDVIGEASAEAQGLTSPITSKQKFISSSDRIYIKRSSEGCNSKVVGFLKVGKKNLFLFDQENNYLELQPLCLLDFYVHESMRRRGCGKQLFEFMLQKENISAHQLAINRPSPKCLAFLCKHYNLKDRIPQINNFVIFNHFFQDRQVPRNRRQWSYEDEGFDPRQTGINPYSRNHFGEGRSKSQVPTLPSINSKRAGNHCILKNALQGNLTSLNKGSYGFKSDTDLGPISGKGRDLCQQHEKYFSTEVFDLKMPPVNSSCISRHPMQSSSACHLNRRQEDTSWNIFGVPSCSSTHHSFKNNPGANNQDRGTLLR